MRLSTKSILKKYKRGEKLVCLTAYDSYFASLADPYVDVILVGDSVGMTVLGYQSTIPVTLDNIIYHTQAVVRGSDRAFVVSDMPFMSSHISRKETLRNAQRLMQEANACAVKIEGAGKMVETISTLIESGVPVMGHLGILPQRYFVEGGYYVCSKQQEERLLKEADALQGAGVFALVLEGVEQSVAQAITKSLAIPTIGIGAGLGCSGQVQVMHDLLGLSSYCPKHSKIYNQIGKQCAGVFKRYADEVREGKFPTKSHSF